MAKTLQHRRGTTAELASVSGAIGEIFMDTEKNTLVVHDGITGHELVSQDSDAVLNSALVGDVSIVANTISGVDSYGNADTLIVDGDFIVQQNISATTTQYFSGSNTANYSNMTASGYPEFQFSQQYNGWSTTDLNTLASLQPGTVVQFTNLSTNYGYVNGYFTVVDVLSSLDYYGYPYVHIRAAGTTVTAGMSGFEYLNSNISNINFSWSVLTASSVDALSVTSAGVNVEGTLTVNGQEITAGGSGASYDQSLNTTDDVVFNSALVGDVSVIGNTISGVDSYGNTDTLVVEGDLTVRYDTQVTTNASLLNGYTNSTYCYFNPATFGSGTFQFSNSNNNGWPVQDLNTLAAIQPGTVVNFTDLSTGYGNSTGSFIVVSATLSEYYGSPLLNLVVSNINVTLGTNGWVPSGSSISNVNWTWSTTTGSIVDVLDVTETGVDITGTLTVNGQAITAGGSDGASYDQSLNTTDDVVFNSGLIGDVSVIGNTISGVDSYGNADALIVDGDFSIQHDATTTSTVSVNNISNNNSWFTSQTIYFRSDSGWSSNQLDSFASLTAGTTVELSNVTVDSYGYSSATGRFVVSGTVTDQLDYYGVRIVQVPLSSYIVDGYGDIVSVSSNQRASTYTWSSTSGEITTTLSVTDGAVNVEGTLTVNGAPLNVLEDIPGAKVVTATADLETTTTYDNPDSAVWGAMDSYVTPWNQSYFPQFLGKYVFRITLQQYGTTTTQESDMLSLNIGDQLILPGWSGTETTRVTLASQFARYDTGSTVVLAAELTTDSPSSGSAPYSITLVRPYTQSASFSFAADGNFVAPSLLADSALIGDVSIVGNAIAGVDSYGNPDDLLLEGTVVYTGETSETPTNTSSVNKWLKVGAQVPNIVTTITQYNTGVDMSSAFYSGAGQEVQLASVQPSLNQALLALPVASTIDILLSGIGWSTVTITSISNDGGGGYSISVAESLSSSNIDAIKISTTTTGPDVIEYFYVPLYK